MSGPREFWITRDNDRWICFEQNLIPGAIHVIEKSYFDGVREILKAHDLDKKNIELKADLKLAVEALENINGRRSCPLCRVSEEIASIALSKLSGLK